LLILDTDIASAFAKSGHFDALTKLFESVGITPTVYEEDQIIQVKHISKKYRIGMDRNLRDVL
jgi:predicted nucleic acid-binding protein